MPFISLLLLFIFIFLENLELHASALTAVAEIQPIEFQNQGAVPIRSLAFSPVDGRPNLYPCGIKTYTEVTPNHPLLGFNVALICLDLNTCIINLVLLLYMRRHRFSLYCLFSFSALSLLPPYFLSMLNAQYRFCAYM